MSNSKDFFKASWHSISFAWNGLQSIGLEPRTPHQIEQANKFSVQIRELEDFAQQLRHLSELREASEQIRDSIAANHDQFGDSLSNTDRSRAASIETWINNLEESVLDAACLEVAKALLIINEILEWGLTNKSS